MCTKYNELYMNKYILIREQSFNSIIVHYLFNFYTFFHTFGLGEYSTLFLVSPSLVGGNSSMIAMVKSKALQFNLLGEGNLPSVCVTRPALRDSQGNPVLQFRRLLAGRRCALPLVLRNDGNMAAQVKPAGGLVCV